MSVDLPKVTVLMPVYNGEKYLKEAVESILNQTFRDFEFIIINDGSMDGTSDILARYQQTDNRIRVYHQENQGLVASLNRGCQLAKGMYIARMDADDISLPERFAKQVDYLEANPDIGVLGTQMEQIDEKGNSAGYWADDMKTVTPSEIRGQLPRTNCIAHPSVMIRTSIAREYRYNEKQLNSEDYDLWLRLTSDGKEIGKIDEPLLRYRGHSTSLTYISNRTMGPAWKNIKTKAIFLQTKVASRRLNRFDLEVLGYLLLDLMLFFLMRTRRFIEPPLRRVLTGIGRVLGFFLPYKNPSSIFFFFPHYHVGGAEKVHADIVACVADQKPWVFFTNRSKDHKFKFLFEETGARLFDLSAFAKNSLIYRLTYFVLVGAMATIINRHSNPVVFGSNSGFFYHLIPNLRPRARCIDLVHALVVEVAEVSLPVVQKLNTRVIITSKTLSDLKEQYLSHGISSEIADRIVLIENKVSIPDKYPVKRRGDRLKVLYIGRGTEEKRVHLVGKAAAQCRERGIPAEFTLIGDVGEAVEKQHRASCIFKGETADMDQLRQLYEEADLLVLTSSREGFPIVIMEAMAHGVVPVSTDVGGISTHVKHGVNGMLITCKNETEIVDSLVGIIENLATDRMLLNRLSCSAYEYARTHFEPSRFCAAYRQLLLVSSESNSKEVSASS